MYLTTISDLSGINDKIFFLINGVRSPLIDEVMVLGTHVGSFWNLSWIVAAAALILLAPRLAPSCSDTEWLPGRDTVIEFLTRLLAAYAMAAFAVTTLKVGLYMPRPPVALPAGSVHVLVQPESPFSFPSGHAAFAMLVSVVFWPYCRRWSRALLALFVVWVGLSRISVGAHFPVDVITGYFCGAISAWFGSRILTFRSLERSLSIAKKYAKVCLRFRDIPKRGT